MKAQKKKEPSEDEQIARVDALLKGKEGSRVHIKHIKDEREDIGVYVGKEKDINWVNGFYVFVWRSPKDKEAVEGVRALVNDSFSIEDLGNHLEVRYEASCLRMYLSPDRFSGKSSELAFLNRDKSILEKLKLNYQRYISLLKTAGL